MNRAFTLIELLVVMSIISMLSSFVLVAVTQVRMNARDSVRLQEIRQIDFAIRMYKDSYGHAPDLQGSCSAEGNAPAATEVQDCLAYSRDSVPSDPNNSWSKFQADLVSYMPKLPIDPCGDGCVAHNGESLGYVYMTPRASEWYWCGSVSCTYSILDLNQNYKLTAPFEKSGMGMICYESNCAAARTSPCGNIGDPDDDGWVSTYDQSLIRSAILGRITLTSEQFDRSDVNNSGSLDTLDTIYMTSYVNRFLNTFPACGS